MMKDLKHYFSSPKVNAEVKETDNSLSEVLNLEDKIGRTKDKLKKKRRKRKFSDSDVSLVDLTEENFEPTDKKKKKSNVLKAKSKVNGCPVSNDIKSGECENEQYETPKAEKRSKNNSMKNKKLRDSTSSKENSTLSDADDKVVTTPDNTKNLLNYFNKVDKLPETVDWPKKIQVKVLIHADSSGSPPTEITMKRPSLKKRKSSKRKSVVDFDLITSEELPEDLTNGLCSISETNFTNGSKADLSSISNASNHNEKEDETRVSDVKSKSNQTVKILFDEKTSRIKKKSQKQCNEEINLELENSKIVSVVKQEKMSHKNNNIMLNTITEQVSNNLSRTEQIHNVLEEDNVIIIEEEEHEKKIEGTDVIIVENMSKEKPKAKHDGTLASFLNLGNRPLPTSIEKRTSAKVQFLLSGAPPSTKRISSNINCQGNVAPFPSKSHLQQKDRMNIVWNLNNVNLNLKPVKDDFVVIPEWSSMIDKRKAVLIRKESNNFDKKSGLKDLKKELNLFPISCWIKELKKMNKGNETCMWTERYRPHSSSAFLANIRSISKLKAWLTELKETSVSESGASSSDEFIKEGDPEHISDRKTVILLTGPPGTGKTASVYAIAEEIGYNVLEINASCNRSGKRILNEFSEAMQSHKVGVSKLNFSKTKKKNEEPKRNLILIEDADLIFEDDEGFVPTLMNLGASTKRPIILVANNPYAKHFGKLFSLFHAMLPFVPPTYDRLGSWLRTVSAVEGFHLTTEKSKELALSQDLRKCLLQLQLMLFNTRNTFKENEKENQVWESISDLEFSSRKSRKKALRITSALAGLDIIRQKKRIGGILPYWYKPLEDSTVNMECMATPDHALDDIEASLLGLISIPYSSSGTSLVAQFEVPKNLLEVEKDVCNMTSILNRRSLALDYWPALRHISRNEVARLATHTKRNNRYFNYLSSLGVKGPPDLFQSLASSFS